MVLNLCAAGGNDGLAQRSEVVATQLVGSQSPTCELNSVDPTRSVKRIVKSPAPTISEALAWAPRSSPVQSSTTPALGARSWAPVPLAPVDV